MYVKIKNNKIFIKDAEIAFLNANVFNESTICIELIKVRREYRNKKYAKNILEKSINYFKQLGFKEIKLIALPLDSKGLEINELKDFYKKFDFFETNLNKNEMIKYL